MHAVVAVLRVLLLAGAILLLSATTVDVFAVATNNTVVDTTIEYGAYKTTIRVDGVGSSTTAAKCGSEGNAASALNSSDVSAACTAICTTKKVAVVVPVVLGFLGVVLLAAWSGHGWKSPLYATTSKTRWRGAAWCGILSAVVYTLVIVLYVLESGSGPQWGVCRFASDDTDTPTYGTSFYLAAVGTGIVGILSLPLLCAVPPEDEGVDTSSARENLLS